MRNKRDETFLAEVRDNERDLSLGAPPFNYLLGHFDFQPKWQENDEVEQP